MSPERDGRAVAAVRAAAPVWERGEEVPETYPTAL
jgi:hypothetical protein